MILRHIGILILVYQNILKVPSVLLQYIRVLFKKLNGLQKKIIKIQCVSFFQSLFILCEVLHHLLRLIALPQILCWMKRMVFGIRKKPRQHPLGKDLVV